MQLKCTELLDPGESALQNVVRWHKNQDPAERGVPAAGVEVSTLGSMRKAFMDTGRFSLVLLDQKPLIVFLNISQVQAEDSGWYTCFAVSGSQTVSITYELYVYGASERGLLRHACACVSTYTCTCTYIYVCMYAYTYTYTRAYTYSYIYT